jgi:alpha-tubulin suppressor-like RCC1 family protein
MKGRVILSLCVAVVACSDGEDPSRTGGDPTPASGWLAVGAGADHTCAIWADRTVWCWGNGVTGQLGYGTPVSTSTPMQALGLTGAVEISAGWTHNCVRRDDGTAACWGNGDSGQLGNAAFDSRAEPVTVSGLTNAVSIVAGAEHSCAATATGEARCWGEDLFHALGTTVAGDISAVPVPVDDVSGIVEVTASSWHSCARNGAGRAWCWGTAAGELGDGSTGDAETPVPVSSATGLTAMARIAAGDENTCAIDTDGGAWCWGLGSDGQIGNGANDLETRPAPVSDLTGAADITVALTHACAVDGAGAAWCWGSNAAGKLGNTGAGSGSNVPVPVTGVSSVRQISAGDDHTCAVTDDARLYCWGSNADGQLGTDAVAESVTPLEVGDPL